MQIVINISNSLYANLAKIEHGSIASKRILDCVKNGTPLPKGHGRLGDLDELSNDDTVCVGISCTECPFENFKGHSCTWLDFIKAYPAVIAADKEG